MHLVEDLVVFIEEECGKIKVVIDGGGQCMYLKCFFFYNLKCQIRKKVLVFVFLLKLRRKT